MSEISEPSPTLQKQTQRPMNQLITRFMTDFGDTSFTQFIARFLKLKVTTVVLLEVLFMIIGIYFTSQNRLVFIAVAVLNPLIKSMKSQQDGDEPQLRVWVVYWGIMGLWQAIEPILRIVLVNAIPFYDALKLLLVVWLQSDNAQGSKYVYDNFIKHGFNNQLNMVAQLDDIIDKLTNRNM